MTQAIVETPMFVLIHEDKVLWYDERNGMYLVKFGYHPILREIAYLV